jgi:hypothetical protein
MMFTDNQQTTKGHFLSTKLDMDKLLELQSTLGASNQIMARALSSGLKSAGFHFKKALTDAVKGNTQGWPDLKRYPGGSNQVMTKVLRANWAYTGRKGVKQPDGLQKLFGKLARILRYDFVQDKLRVEVGVLPQITGDKSAILARNFQLGIANWGRMDITPSMRRYFAAIGMPFSGSTTRLNPAKRPLFGPVFDAQVKYVEMLVFTVVADKLTKGFAHRDILDKAAGWI